MKILLVHPWDYHDEGVQQHDISREWRNGPYSLLLLATILDKRGHETSLIDMQRRLCGWRGEVSSLLEEFSHQITSFRPEIIGFSFLSMNVIEVRKAVETAREACIEAGLKPVFIGGGIHASVMPKESIKELGLDYAFVGEADTGFAEMADGKNPASIPGIVSRDTEKITKGEAVPNLDELPFPDWNLCDYRFYSHPTWARLKNRKTSSLDILMGRGCYNRCSFCAYNKTTSRTRYYSAEYLIDQMNYMISTFDVRSFYFHDSSLGNNWKLLNRFCEAILTGKLNKKVEWYGNMRVDQVDEGRLKLLWEAGCRYLFYGFESGSQRVLELMRKRTTVEQNYTAAKLHDAMGFPYNASMIIGYPGETEEDMLATLEFIKAINAPSIGLNPYVPLPGSRDYDDMRVAGEIKTDNPYEWRRIGEINASKIYSDVPKNRFHEIVNLIRKESASIKCGKKTKSILWRILSRIPGFIGKSLSKPARASRECSNTQKK
ncbi:MAG: B12-binding domain-containing radical SAM protein [Planctomycetota bacterium]|jgi:radical SAM superfamily enzyme YgiQ (UPF0313 family)